MDDDPIAIPLPEKLRPDDQAMSMISTFWIMVPEFPSMSYLELTCAFLTYLYNNGQKVVPLDDEDLQ